MNPAYPNYGPQGTPYGHENDTSEVQSSTMAYSTSPYMQSNLPPRSTYPDDPYGAGGRRFSNSPQLGYYDLITGEWRYRNAENVNHSPLLSNYAGETEPPMCENTCECCQAKLPFNCLTISLITSLMLLLMFTLFKLILGAKPKNTIDMNLFQDMIWLTLIITIVLTIITAVKYVCLKDRLANSWPFNTVFCERCQLFNSILIDTTPAVHNPNTVCLQPGYKNSEEYYTNAQPNYALQPQARYQMEEFL